MIIHCILHPQHLQYTLAALPLHPPCVTPWQAEEAARRAEKQVAEAAKRAAEREERLRRAAQYQEPEWVRASEAAQQQEEEETEVRAQLCCMYVDGAACRCARLYPECAPALLGDGFSHVCF